MLILGVWVGDDAGDAKAVLSETGVTYPAIQCADTLIDYAGRSIYIPATYFFDGNGNEIGEPAIGSRDYNAWKSIVDSLLP